MLVYDPKTGKTTGFNGSGVAGAKASRERYVEAGLTKMPFDGLHSVSVPGAVAVYETLWKTYGTKPWAELWQPAIRLADEGVVLRSRIAKQISGPGRRARQVPVVGRPVPSRRPAAEGRHPLVSAEPGEQPARRGRGRRRDLLPWRPRRAHHRLPGPRGRSVRGRRLRPPGVRGLRADPYHLPRRDGPPDEPGLAGLPDARAAQHPRRPEPERARPAERRSPPLPGRGEEARLRGSQPRRRRSEARQLGPAPADLEGARRRPPRPDRPGTRLRPEPPAGRRAQRRHLVLLRRGRRRHGRLLHPQPLGRLRQRRGRRRYRHHPQQPSRARVQPRRRPPERGRAWQAHHAYPERLPVPPRRQGRGWSAAPPAATSRPR